MYNHQNPIVFVCNGDPNGQLSGNAANSDSKDNPPDIAWDGAGFWFCTTTGIASGTGQAVWTRMSAQNIETSVFSLGTVDEGVLLLNRANGIVQTLTLAGPVAFELEGFISGYSEFVLELTNGGSATITWPASVNWVTSSGAITNSFSVYGIQLQTTGTDFIIFWSLDGGTTIYGKVIR